MASSKEKLLDYWKKGHQYDGYAYAHYATELLFNKYLKNIENLKILEVGSGHGGMMEFFKERGAIPMGVDIAQESVDFSRARGLEVLRADCRDLPFKNNSFDVVISLGVVEHFRESTKAIHEKFRVCKPGGKVITVVPYVSPYFLLSVVYNLRWILKYNLRIVVGDLFTKSKLATILKTINDSNDLIVTPYCGCAILKPFPLHKGLAEYIERSCFSKYFGMLLFGLSTKTGVRE